MERISCEQRCLNLCKKVREEGFKNVFYSERHIKGLAEMLRKSSTNKNWNEKEFNEVCECIYKINHNEMSDEDALKLWIRLR